ncbi:MAG TPA: pirin family protein [Polyangia bacterium]|nr:pirin family protein [Polyangia bacterium]
MLTLSPAAQRGRTRIDWLDSRHTFSFGEWYDPAHMGFRALRVINDDRVAAGRGFPTHGHADMEILSYVLEGGLAHEDSLGTGSVIRPGDLQRMSAGTGVRHSEFNASDSEPVHFLQIWIIPDRRGHAPGYEQKAFPEAERRGRLRLVASSDGREGSVSLHQDVALWAGVLDEGQKAELPLAAGRHAWVHVARGAATVNGKRLGEGDGAALSEERAVVLEGHGGEVLVFDLA